MANIQKHQHTQEQPASRTDALVPILRRDLYDGRRKFMSLMGVSDEKDPAFVAWQSEVAHVISQNVKLLEADRESLIASLRTALTLHLSINPALGEAYLIPRWNKKIGRNMVTCQIGYRGLLALMYASDQVERISADAVYKGEHFSYRSGTDPRIDHEPDIIGKSRTGKFDDIVCAYACVWLKGASSPVFRVLSARDLDTARAMNLDRNGNPSAPWQDHAEAMSLKTALTRVANLLPRHSRLRDLHESIAREHTATDDGDPDDANRDDGATVTRWAAACEHFGKMGITPEMLLRFVGAADESALTDDDHDRIEGFYGALRQREPAALADLTALKSSGAPQTDGNQA